MSSVRDGRFREQAVAQLPWRHQIALIEKLSDPELRLWYAGHAIENGWSRDVLAQHIATGCHDRAGHAISNFADTLPSGDSDLAQQATRDPYLFDFIGQTDIRRERDLEQGLIDHLERFLLELGQGGAGCHCQRWFRGAASMRGSGTTSMRKLPGCRVITKMASACRAAASSADSSIQTRNPCAGDNS